MTPEIWAGFAIGFLGSIHCIGMCGPIALALPTGYPSKAKLLFSRILYNGGRVFTYASLGAISGMLGKTVAMAGFQRSLSIAAGVTILLMVIIPSRFTRRYLPAKTVGKATEHLKHLWGRLFRRKGLSSLLVIGILNGFLPCGFLYIGLAGAAATGGILTGSGYMAMFGLGTVPAIFATSMFGGLLTTRVRVFFLRLLPIGGIVLALLLILRGMSLGIPYVSPIMDQQTAGQHPCCH
jgi:sulfite exporter TauE/SafE